MLIGTAVVGATTMIFSTIVALTNGLTDNLDKLSMLHAPFLLGLIAGGAVIYWFTGASAQAVTTGAYRAVEFIKKNIKLDSTDKASVADSKKVVEICTQYAQKGMFNIFLVVFFATLSFAFLEPFFFIGYLISIALFGLYQAIFMANAGGAWDNAKKVVETELRAKGTELHAACVVGDTVGDPFKDTSSVALTRSSNSPPCSACWRFNSRWIRPTRRALPSPTSCPRSSSWSPLVFVYRLLRHAHRGREVGSASRPTSNLGVVRTPPGSVYFPDIRRTSRRPSCRTPGTEPARECAS